MTICYFCRSITKLLLLVFLFAGVVVSTTNAAYAQDNTPLVESVDPLEVLEGREQTVIIQGRGFNSLEDITLSLDEDRYTIEPNQASDTSIQFSIPPEMPVGDYRLCVQFEDFRDCPQDIAVIPYTEPTITSVDPDVVHNDEQKILTIRGEGLVDPIAVSLDETQIENVEVVSSDEDGQEILAVIPSDYPEGVYTLSIFTAGSEIEASTPLEVKGPALVTEITPTNVLRFQNAEITITGENLEDAEQIDPLMGSVNSISDQELEVRLRGDDNYLLLRDGWSLDFPDDSTVTLPTLTILDPVWPWNTISRVTVALFFALASLSIFFASSGHSTHIRNKTAPGLRYNIIILITLFSLSIVSVGAIGLIWELRWEGENNVSWYFLLHSALMGSNVAMAFNFAHLTGNFYPVAPRPTRYITAIAISFIVLLSPFFLTNLLRTDLAIWIQLGVLATTLTLGNIGLRHANRKLDEERNQLSDAELLSRVERTLFRKGEIHPSDLDGQPEDRVKRAIERYYNQHQTSYGLLYETRRDKLSFNRSQAIKSIADAEDKFIEGSYSQATAQRLAQQIQQEFGFAKGEDYPRLASMPLFEVISTKPTGLESVLPDPFPIIILLSETPLNSEQAKELKNLLNVLDVPSRIGILITLDNAYASTADLIRQQFRGATTRENLVVLSIRELLEIIVTQEKTIQEIFMQAIQKQVDMKIFSPYQTKSPTRLDMLKGRREELNTLLERIDIGSVAVIGARRIGKTSILQAAQRALHERGKHLEYLDCYGIDNYETFFDEIDIRWELDRHGIEPCRKPSDFSRMIRDLQERSPENNIVLQFDEVDRLMQFDIHPDRGENLFRAFRSLAQEKRCQFIFSGERTILDLLHNPQSAFFNFVTDIRLNLLDKSSVRELVEIPMTYVGVRILESEQTLTKILEATEGHPNLIQTLCEQMLYDLNRFNQRQITPQLVDKTAQGQEFQSLYVETFWSQATRLEKVITILVAQYGKATTNDLYKELQTYDIALDIDSLNRSLRYLELCHLLHTDVDGYRIKPRRFAQSISQVPYDQQIQGHLSKRV